MEQEPTPTVPQQPEATPTTQPNLRLACMGSAACARVCKFLDTSTQKTSKENGIPFEQNCNTLESIYGYLQGDNGEPGEYRSSVIELIRATNLPSSSKFNQAQTAEDVTIAITQLQEAQDSFDALLQTKLHAQSKPRAIIRHDEEKYMEAVAAVNADIPKELPDDQKFAKLLIRDQARGFYDRKTLKDHGIMFDGYVRQIMLDMAEKMAAGYHIDLSGEPGVAKTTIAKYMARLNTLARRSDDDTRDAEPIVLNFSSTSEAESHVTEQTYKENTLGKELSDIARAMQDGRGIVLDEYNGLTADQQIFFNDLFLKKPGDTLTIAGQKITIADGFSVIATKNPMTDTQGNRRQGRQQQDSAGAARFERIDICYPGSKAYQAAGGNAKEALSRIFMANWTNHYGWASLGENDLKTRGNIVAFIGELADMATSPPEDTSSMIASTSSAPIIAECISPRDFSRMLHAKFMSSSNPSEDITEAIKIKVDQIVNSDNGHILGTKAKEAVAKLQERHQLAA